MNSATTILAAAAAATAFSMPVRAQDADFQLPEQCPAKSTTGELDHSSMAHGDMHGNQPGGMMDMRGADLEAMPEHARENMRRMMISMTAMHQGMIMEDADVAFACGMIAHHQGAVDMAQVLLEHGDDEQMIELAGEIIAAQVAEIERMKVWLAENAD
ncbi:DUF305 domain-containing protein [Jannaschia formosa]|uniref:DUF305 domain-containing protein n=1 Tax=Jannaschia formosa TaxID=2259592 RepID=UPI000E1B5474|nr:DUF305 domain-containing protein [Jannaschia formosa]TFL17270.1 DUF305 domain-containing protein [Jannaschia formosa]